MGIIIHECESEHEEVISDSLKCYILDDGTATILIAVPNIRDNECMGGHRLPKLGQTIDCVGEIISQKNMGTEKENEKMPRVFLRLHYFSPLTDDFMQAETLRMFEIACHSSSTNEEEEHEQNNSKIGPEDVATAEFLKSRLGSFSPSRHKEKKIRKHDALRILQSGSSNGGITEEEMVLIFFHCGNDSCKNAVAIECVRQVLQELQADGEIYRDLEGRYLPL